MTRKLEMWVMICLLVLAIASATWQPSRNAITAFMSLALGNSDAYAVLRGANAALFLTNIADAFRAGKPGRAWIWVFGVLVLIAAGVSGYTQNAPLTVTFVAFTILNAWFSLRDSMALQCLQRLRERQMRLRQQVR